MSFWSTMARKMKGMMLRRGPMMITCAEFEDFILDYQSDRLTPRQRFIFELHLKVCRDCRDYLRAYQRTVELGKAVFQSDQAQVPAEVPEDLIAAILAARSAD